VIAIGVVDHGYWGSNRARSFEETHGAERRADAPDRTLRSAPPARP
jgi:hypothetical protein